MAFFDILFGDLAQEAHDVGHAVLAVFVSKHIVPECARLLEVRVRVLVRVAANLAGQLLARKRIAFVLSDTAVHIRLVIWGASAIVVDSHGAIAEIIVAHARTIGAVDGDLVVVCSNAVTMSIHIVDEAALQHLVVARLNSRHKVSWGERNLLGLSVVVSRIAVQSDFANLLQWVVAVWPYFGDVEDIETVLFGVLLRHDLDIPGPAREVSFLNFCVQVMGGPLGVLLALLGCFCSSEIFDSLVRLVVVLHVVDFALVIHPAECVRAVSIHVAIPIGSSAIAH